MTCATGVKVERKRLRKVTKTAGSSPTAFHISQVLGQCQKLNRKNDKSFLVSSIKKEIESKYPHDGSCPWTRLTRVQ